MVKPFVSVIGISNPDGLFNRSRKRFGNGSIINVQEKDFSELATTMQRQFLEDLNQKSQRIESNQCLKEEKQEDLEKLKKECLRLAKEISIAGKDGDIEEACKKLAEKEKCKKKELKKRCKELAEREKCEKRKLKKKCKEMAKKGKDDPC